MNEIDFTTFALLLGGAALLITLALILIGRNLEEHGKPS